MRGHQAQAALCTNITMTNDSPNANNNDDHWLVQYCLFGPDRGSLAVIPAADAIRQNLGEAKKNVPRNFWVTVGLECSESQAKAARKTIRQELSNGYPGNHLK